MDWIVVVIAVIVVGVALGVWLGVRRDRRPDAATPTIASGRRGPVVDDAALWHEIDAELRASRKIHAIKLLRERTGLGLREAKDAVDEFARTGRRPGIETRKPVGDGLDP